MTNYIFIFNVQTICVTPSYTMSHKKGLVTMMHQRNIPTDIAHIAIWDEKYEIYTDDEYFDHHGSDHLVLIWAFRFKSVPGVNECVKDAEFITSCVLDLLSDLDLESRS